MRNSEYRTAFDFMDKIKRSTPLREDQIIKLKKLSQSKISSVKSHATQILRDRGLIESKKSNKKILSKKVLLNQSYAPSRVFAS